MNRIASLFFLLFCFASTAFSQEARSLSQTGNDVDLQRELEWLQAEAMVFSASRREQKRSEVASSIFVITSEDIRRSTANSIPELLRLVPGIQVSRINGNTWAITSRGMQSRYEGRLLVLMDGRTLYTPLFAGTYWDVQDTALADIERIEVIKGPGASMWGANAVQGIINIITKHAEKTQGGKLVAWAGKEEKGGVSIRYGTELAKKSYLRLYGKKLLRGNQALHNGGRDSYDGIDIKRTGFRLDSELSGRNEITLQGDLYEGKEDELKRDAVTQTQTDVWGGNILGKWKHSFSDTSEATLQVYFDRTFRKTSTMMDSRDTFDVDVQHVYRPAPEHQLVWGLGYRFLKDRITSYSVLHFFPPKSSEDLFTGFIQDQIKLSDEMTLTLGTKIERNVHTGYEIQPTAKLLWQLQEGLSLWASVSRAVYTPSRAEREMKIIIPIFPGFDLTVQHGNPDLRAERVIAYEMGIRKTFGDFLSFDISTFINDYKGVVTTYGAMNEFYHNSGQGSLNGGELALTAILSERIKVKGGYSFVEGKLRERGTKAVLDILDGTPRHQVQLTSQINLPYDIEFDTQLFYHSGFIKRLYPEYYSLNVRLAWKPVDSVELSLVGTNLLLPRHHEYEDTSSIAATDIRRTIFGKITWDF